MSTYDGDYEAWVIGDAEAEDADDHTRRRSVQVQRFGGRMARTTGGDNGAVGVEVRAARGTPRQERRAPSRVCVRHKHYIAGECPVCDQLELDIPMLGERGHG